MVKDITFKQLVDLLIADSSYNFVATAITPWHALSCSSSINSINNVTLLKGIVLFYPREFGEYYVDESHFDILKEVSVEYYKINQGEEKLIKFGTIIQQIMFSMSSHNNRLRCLYVFSPWYPNIYMASGLYHNVPDIKITHVTYDEGISTYMYPKNKFQWSRNNSVLQNLRKCFSFFITMRFCMLQIKHNHKIIDTKLYYKKGKSLVVNTNIRKAYRAILNKNNVDLQIDIKPNSVIICTNAWDRDQFCGKPIDISIIEVISKKLINIGYNVYVKPHPRDLDYRNQYKNVDCSFLEYRSLSMEQAIANMPIKPVAIIGFSTTVLLTCRLFWNIKPISLIGLLNFESLPDFYKNEVTSFINIFGESVVDIKQLEDLNILL